MDIFKRLINVKFAYIVIRRRVLFGKSPDFSQKYQYSNDYQIHSLKHNRMKLL